ncbi:MAG TPA: RluA family pseudouridine synthase [Bacillota bacterium]|jgi:23S rRNA pseudouridine1911/1915/1917 synthase
MPARTIDLITGPGDDGLRVDQFLASRPEADLTRSHARRLIDEGRVTVDGETVKASRKLAAGAAVRVAVPAPEPLQVVGEDIPLDIVFEDADLLVINKSRGMVVHPAAGHGHGTLVNALLRHCKDLSGINDVIRPGIVHRLDRDTTGLLVVAKTDQAHLSLAEQIKDRRLKRRYLAVVSGGIKDDRGVIEAPIARHPVDRKRMAVVEGGRPARTRFTVRERFPRATLVEAELDTGRTHQIRVHFSFIGHPVLGDPVYGPKKKVPFVEGQALHAWSISFRHPRTGEEMTFTREPPGDFETLVGWLRGQR